MNTIVSISELLLELGLSSSVTDEERAIAQTALVRSAAAVRQYLGYDPVYGEHTEYYPKQQANTQDSEGVWEADGNSAVLRQTVEGATGQLQLQSLPVRSVTSLRIDYDGRSGAKSGSFSEETEKVEGEDYWPNYDKTDSDGDRVCSDGVVMSVGAWPNSPGTIQITYYAGYTQEELHGQDTSIDASPIQEAVLYEAVRRVRRHYSLRKSTRTGFVAGAITSESLGDYSYSADGASAAQLDRGGSLTPETKEKLSPFLNYGFMM